MQIRTRVRAALGAAVTTVLLSTAVGTTQAAPSGAEPSSLGVAVARSEAEPGSVKDFWTPERIREAITQPVDTPTVAAIGPRARGANPAPRSPDVSLSGTAVAPKGYNGSMSVLAAEASVAGVSRSFKNAAATLWPFTPTGWMVFEKAGGGYGSCSGAVIVHANKSTVWTAAHCMHSGKGGAYNKSAAFVPARDGDNFPAGVWEKDTSYVPSKWISDSDARTGDMAAFTVRSDPALGQIQDVVGAYGFQFRSNSPENDSVHSLGYPVDGYNRPNTDFLDGAYMFGCFGSTVDADNWNPLDQRLKLECDMGHGASGGPVVKNLTSSPQIVGVNSHRYADASGTWIDNYMFSSEHGAQAMAVYNAVR